MPFGTHPEIVKLAPLVRALRVAGDEITVVATWPHYDAALTEVFYDELGFRPDIALNTSGVRSKAMTDVPVDRPTIHHELEQVRTTFQSLLGGATGGR